MILLILIWSNVGMGLGSWLSGVQAHIKKDRLPERHCQNYEWFTTRQVETIAATSTYRTDSISLIEATPPPLADALRHC